MEEKEIRRYEMVTRVRDFGAERAASFPAATLGGELFAAVDAAARELAGHVAAQISGGSAAQQGTATKAASRAALREQLEMIRRTARSMSLTAPALDSKFRIPRNSTDQELLGTARAFAADATPLKGDFLRFALPADFLDELNEQIEEFEAATSRQQKGKGHQVSATAAIDETLERALSAVRQLDAIVRNTFRQQPSLLAAWESARHVERTARTKKTTETAPPAKP